MPETTVKSSTLNTIVIGSVVAAVAVVIGYSTDFTSSSQEFDKVGELARTSAVAAQSSESVTSPVPPTATPVAVALAKEVALAPDATPTAQQTSAPVAAVTPQPAAIQVAQAPRAQPTVPALAPFDPAPAGTPAAGTPANNPPPASVLSYPAATVQAPPPAGNYPVPPQGSAPPVCSTRTGGLSAGGGHPASAGGLRQLRHG